MKVRAIWDIYVGEEITVSYSDHYFGNDNGNCECCCKTCKKRLQNRFEVKESSENAVLQPPAELTMEYHNTRQRKRPC